MTNDNDNRAPLERALVASVAWVAVRGQRAALDAELREMTVAEVRERAARERQEKP